MAFGNIVRKGENAGNQHFLLFSQCIYSNDDKFKFLSHDCHQHNAFDVDKYLSIFCG